MINGKFIKPLLFLKNDPSI